MINASSARGLASIPQQRKRIEKLIREAAEKGEPGVWIPYSGYELHKFLQEEGYETTIGNAGGHNYEDGKCRKNQTWVWWGYSK